MTMANTAFSSETVNRIVTDSMARRERSILRQNAEKEALIRWQPIANWGLTFINMIVAFWICYAMTADAGIGEGWNLSRVDLSFIPNMVGGLCGAFLAYLCTSTAASLGDAGSIAGKVVLALVLAMGLIVSIWTSTFGEMVVIETANHRSQAVDTRADSRSAVLQSAKDREADAKAAYDANRDSLDQATERLRRAKNAELAAVEDEKSWRVEVIGQFGRGSAAANRRFAPGHPENVAHRDAIARATTAREAAEAFLADRQRITDASYTHLVDARDALRAENVRFASGIEAPNRYYAAADAMAANFGMSGREMLAWFAIGLAIFMSVVAPLMGFANALSTRPAMKAGERHRAHQQALREADAVAASLRQPPAPVAAPPHTLPQGDTDVATLKRQYASKCADAINDAQIGALTEASYVYLKRKYSVNDDGATAIRHALVDEGLAIWDGNRCKVTV